MIFNLIGGVAAVAAAFLASASVAAVAVLAGLSVLELYFSGLALVVFAVGWALAIVGAVLGGLTWFGKRQAS